MRITRSVLINAPVEQVFDFAKDIGKLFEWHGITTIDVKLTPEVVGSTGRFGFNFLPGWTGVLEYIEAVPNERIVAKHPWGPIVTFTFTPVDGGTELRLDNEMRVDLPFVGGPIEQLMQKVEDRDKDWDTWLASIKARVEGVPVPAQAKPSSKLVRSTNIKAPVESVFDFALDVGRLWTCFPDCAAREVTLTPDGVGSSARIYTHWLGLHMEGVVEVVEVVRNQRIVAKAAFAGEGPTWTFMFEPADGDTRLTGEGVWESDMLGIGKRMTSWAAKMHADFLEIMLAAVKNQLEAKEDATV